MRSFKKTLASIFLIPSLIFFSIFTASNNQIIEIKFWPFEYILQVPLWLSILFSLFSGIIFGSLLMLIPQIKMKLKSTRLSSQLIKYQNLNNNQKTND